MSEFGKPILEKTDENTKKNRKSNSKCRQREQKTASEKSKFDSIKTRPRMNGLYHFKNPKQKNGKKTVKTKVKLPHVNKNH